MAPRAITRPQRSATRARSSTAAFAVLAVSAALGAVLAEAGARVITVGAPRDVLAATPQTVLELVAHNLPVALWPLALIVLGWPALPGARQAGDVLVGGQLLGHGAIVGNALVQQPGLWRYLPHLPVEWLALALPVAAWAQARAGRSFGVAGVVEAAGRVVMLLVLAAVVETYLVPLP
jgi:hypothetical protein